MPFILQQAVWLYEKELEHVRDQMLRINRNSHSIKQPGLGTDVFSFFLFGFNIITVLAPYYKELLTIRSLFFFLARVAAQEISRSPRQSGSPRSRASSSFSPRRQRKTSNVTEDGRYHNLGQRFTSRPHDIMASPNRSISSEDPDEEGGAVSRRLLSQSRMLQFQTKESLDDNNNQTEDDELDDELYEAFLPMKVSNNNQTKNNDGNSTSFSDLSDLSVSKSALEEALLSGYGGSIS